MNSLLDVGVTVVRASSPEQLMKLLPETIDLIGHQNLMFKVLNVTTVHAKLLALLQFLWLLKQL